MISLDVKSVSIKENLLNNSKSEISFLCVSSKYFPAIFRNNLKLKSLLESKLNYDEFEIRLCLISLFENHVQSQNEEGYIPLEGNMWIAKDKRGAYINLSAEINYSNWHKLKSDILTTTSQKLSFEVGYAFLNKQSEDDDSFELDIQMSLHKYCIEHIFK